MMGSNRRENGAIREGPLHNRKEQDAIFCAKGDHLHSTIFLIACAWVSSIRRIPSLPTTTPSPVGHL